MYAPAHFLEIDLLKFIWSLCSKQSQTTREKKKHGKKKENQETFVLKYWTYLGKLVYLLPQISNHFYCKKSEPDALCLSSTFERWRWQIRLLLYLPVMFMALPCLPTWTSTTRHMVMKWI